MFFSMFASEMVNLELSPLQYNAIAIRRCSITIYYRLHCLIINLTARFNNWGISSAHSVVASHAGDPSSIPGKDNLFFFFSLFCSFYAFNILKHRILIKFAFSNRFWRKQTMLKNLPPTAWHLRKFRKNQLPLWEPHTPNARFFHKLDNTCLISLEPKINNMLTFLKYIQ